jgi:hypothetical protein
MASWSGCQRDDVVTDSSVQIGEWSADDERLSSLGEQSRLSLSMVGTGKQGGGKPEDWQTKGERVVAAE